MNFMNHKMDGPSRELFEDIQELCTCCARSVVVISQKHYEDPRLVSQLFLEAYQKINDDLNKNSK